MIPRSLRRGFTLNLRWYGGIAIEPLRPCRRHCRPGGQGRLRRGSECSEEQGDDRGQRGRTGGAAVRRQRAGAGAGEWHGGIDQRLCVARQLPERRRSGRAGGGEGDGGFGLVCQRMGLECLVHAGQRCTQRVRSRRRLVRRAVAGLEPGCEPHPLCVSGYRPRTGLDRTQCHHHLEATRLAAGCPLQRCPGRRPSRHLRAAGRAGAVERARAPGSSGGAVLAGHRAGAGLPAWPAQCHRHADAGLGTARHRA
ncbi:hypothetical protein D3C81_1297940 [compost metagenome]